MIAVEAKARRATRRPTGAAMRLFHFSEDPAIATFEPRPVIVPSRRPLGKEWLNGPLVWAIEKRFDFLYLFPRDCPRILIWPTARTSDADKVTWLGERRAAAYIESKRQCGVETATIQRYELPTHSFEDLHDAGMLVSQVEVKPLRRDALSDLPAALSCRGVDLRIVESLVPLRPLWDTTLHVSGVRLRNATGWV